MNTKIKTMLSLHVLLMLYSLTSICSKLAGRETFLSFKFCIFYSVIILLLGIYAIGWQQVIKRLPLTTAFANKAVTVIWGIVWGMIFFREKVTLGKIAGAVIVFAGVVIYAKADEDEINE